MADDTAPNQPATATILVVDDSPDIRDLLDDLLTDSGYHVLLAETGRQAMATADRETVHLILMDMSIPEMDGWTIVPLLRAMSRLAHLPIIALTAHATAEDQRRALAVGCTGYISKPFDADDFLDQIAGYLGAAG